MEWTHAGRGERRAPWRTLWASALAAGLAGCGTPADPRPDLLLITVDRLATSRVACDVRREPTRLCAIARRSIRYDWAISPATGVAPAIASIFTSRYPSHHGLGDSPASFLPSAATTLAEELREASYTTAAVVGTAALNRSRNLAQGFDSYDDGPWQATRTGGARAAAETAAAAIELGTALPHPWFLWVHFGEPEPEIGDLQDARQADLDQTLEREIDRVVASLGKDGHRRAIAFAAARARPSESGEPPVDLARVRVPLLWQPPGSVGGERVATAVSSLDIAPTLLRAAGRDTPESFEDGAALPSGPSPLGASERLRPIFSEGGGWVAIVAGRDYYARPRLSATPSSLGELALGETSGRSAVLAAARHDPVDEPALAQAIAARLEPELSEFLAPGRAAADAGAQP